MYFVTSKNPEYVLFCMTPSERAAVGLTEKNVVHFLVQASGDHWHVLREWPGATFSHTEFMTALGKVDEPADPRQLLQYLPATLRD